MQVRLNAGMPRPRDGIEVTPLGKRLQLARKKRRLSQEQLAAAAGLKQADISKLENGLMRSTTKGIELALALRVAPEWLASGKGPEPLWETTAAPDMPAAPPPQFADRRQVDDSDWALLNDVKLVLPDEEIQRIRAEADRVRRTYREQMSTVSPPQTHEGSDGTMIDNPHRQQRREKDEGAA